MTQHELSQLVRDHVSSDEPPFAGPDDVLARGRRRVRGRRLATGGVAALVGVVAMGGALMVATGDEPAGGGGATIDPATQEALADYDASAMPELLDRQARTVFARSVDGLGESTFRAFDGNQEQVPAEHYDKASGMSAAFDLEGSHRLAVDLSHSKGEAEGDAQEYCADGLAEGWYLDCTVETVDGSVVISQLWALRPDRGRFMRVVQEDRLGVVDPDRLFFERTVKVIKSETFVTYVSERVMAPTRDAAQDLFEVPVADLVELGLDPVLVMPPPPPGQNGCPAWLLHPENISCGVAGEPAA